MWTWCHEQDQASLANAEWPSRCFVLCQYAKNLNRKLCKTMDWHVLVYLAGLGHSPDIPPREKCKQCSLNRSWTDETIFIKWKLDWWNNSLLTRSWTDDRNLGSVAKTWYSDETNPKTNLHVYDPHIWWNTFFVQMEAGLMKKIGLMTVISANVGVFIGGEMSGGNVRIP